MSEYTDRFHLPLLVQGQGQKDMTHNEALAHIDMVLHPAVESRTIDKPPVDPQPGQAWLVPADAQGVWEAHGQELAAWSAAGWRYSSLQAGTLLWVKGEQALLCRGDGGWMRLPLPSASSTVIDSPSGGTTVDVEARAALTMLLGYLRDMGLIA